MNRLYAEELQILRKEAEAFSNNYPALAPMLSGQSNDPDVERLLEGTAYLCARIQGSLEQTAPDLAQSLLQLIFPQALLPLPSSTIMQFFPRRGFNESVFVPKGTPLSSRPIDGVQCTYTTDTELYVHPVAVTDVVATPSAGGERTSVTMTLSSAVPFAPIVAKGLEVHLAGEYSSAAQRFFVLLRHLESVTLTRGRQSVNLPGNCVRQRNFPLADSRLAGQKSLNRAYMEILRYFYLPHQLLYFEIAGLDKCPGLSESGDLTITFHCRSKTVQFPDFDKNSFVLNSVSATNIFSVDAEPLVFEHTRTEYRIQPVQRTQRKLEILCVERVDALFPGGKVEEYTPFDSFVQGKNRLCYSLRHCPTSIPERTDFFISPVYVAPFGDSFAKQTVAVRLRCCNHTLPSHLGVGDINVATDTTPMQVTFRNINVPTGMQPRNMTETHLWLHLSQETANLLPRASAEVLRTMLELYLYNKSSNPELVAANLRRCSAIKRFSSQAEHRIVRGRLHRGQRLDILLDTAAFTSEGDMHLFANSLNRFLSCFATINNYTRLVVESAGTGEVYTWTPRLGQKRLN
jgi:type VI secretion protein, VC_A0110 family